MIFFSSQIIIILSQTYYYKNWNQKNYLMDAINNHELLKDPKFWEDLFNYEMDKEIKRVNKIDIKNNLYSHIEFNSENLKKKSNLAFGQIMTLSNNMLEFGLSPQVIYQIMEPKIKYYNIGQKSVKTIKSVIGLADEEKDTSNDNNKEIVNKENQENDKK